MKCWLLAGPNILYYIIQSSNGVKQKCHTIPFQDVIVQKNNKKGYEVYVLSGIKTIIRHLIEPKDLLSKYLVMIDLFCPYNLACTIPFLDVPQYIHSCFVRLIDMNTSIETKLYLK